MGKRGKGPKKDNRNSKRRTRDEYIAAEDMDDEIDAFHKQRDKISLDINGDAGESDEDNEQPVFDFEDNNDEEEEDEDIDDDAQLTGLAAKIARQQKYIRAKNGGVDDEMHDDDDDDDDDEKEKQAPWGGKKNIYYNADNVDYELQSSDEELPAEEEAEVLRLQREKAKSLSMEDFGLDDISQEDTDGEPTLEEILVKGKSASKFSAEKDAEDDTGAAYEEIEKDLNSLSKEEQMDVVYSSAPELVGLLSELNDALEQLENKVNPLLSKVKQGKSVVKGEMHYLEVKQVLLLSYCQAINFYLLLKSEGEPVRDHPVIARLVEIKSLLDKIKQLDEPLEFEFEEILNKKDGDETEVKLDNNNDTLASDSSTKIQRHSPVSAETEGTTVNMLPSGTTKLVKVDSLKDHGNGTEKRKRQNDQVGIQSMEMLKVRAALEEKLKRKGIFSSNSLKLDKAQKHRLQPVNGQLETRDDFDDETINMEGGTNGLNNGHANSLRNKVSQLVTTAKVRKPKIVSGDDDLPQRDDIGERRRKHELQVLAGAGIKSEEEFGKLEGDGDAVMEADSETEESEDDFYKQVKQQRAAKLAAKAEIYIRPLATPFLPETLVDGKRQISYQMEKNRGLTRARKKLTKNPRKKYKLKHQKAVVRRKGQVRDIKKPAGPYGGEASGINAGISRSVRFKN